VAYAAAKNMKTDVHEGTTVNAKIFISSNETVVSCIHVEFKTG
jgi:purine-nucleoside phosphorylase